MQINSIDDIATDSLENRYIHICDCSSHTCDFKSESLNSIISVCSGGDCDGCDSIISRSYKPSRISNPSELPSPFNEALKGLLEEKEYLEPLKEELLN